MICSKLASLGYPAKDICIINVYPIKSLYENLQIIPIDVNDFSAIAPHLLAAETMENKKNLIAVAERKCITEFKQKYSKHFGRPISSVTIDGTNEKERTTDKWKEEFKNAKYVFGINIITTGFDLSTWVEGQEFSLGIMSRKLSDKISQPLSKNNDHVLHMDTAASLMQLLARLRKGGIFLIPPKLNGRSLYDRLVEVFVCIKNGLNEYDWVGGNAAVTQIKRHHQGLIIALIQNIREGNRPIVDGILSDLKGLTDRDFESEMKANLESHSSFDHEFWTGWIGCLWTTYLVEHESFLSPEDKEAKKAEIIANHRRGTTITGGGERNERSISERVKEEVKNRSNNTCGHCGRKFYEGYIPQICHMKRHDKGGTATLDNLFLGHWGCDATFDSDREILYDERNGVWLRGNAVNYNPDKNQLTEMSLENILHRWNWEKEQLGLADLSDKDFREHLKANYIYKKYA
jgi:5-methylcytosine-specific restriction endonuclease McrA